MATEIEKATLGFDTLRAARQLMAAGFNKEQAEAIVYVIRDAIIGKMELEEAENPTYFSTALRRVK